MSVDEVDRRLLNVLVEDAKGSYRTLARRLGVSAATVMKRVRRLEKEKVIRGYAALLDYEKLGYDLTVVVDVRVSKGRLLEVEKKIAHHPNVFILYDLTGTFDTVILGRFRNRRSLDQFVKRLQKLEFVERTETKIVLNTIKEEPQRVL